MQPSQIEALEIPIPSQTPTHSTLNQEYFASYIRR